MLRDVFYFGDKPNVHPRERYAQSLQDAREKCTTEHFWIIDEFCDYTGFDWDFDFDFLPDEDVWAEDHNNIWPSIYQKDSGTWLCSKESSDIRIYRTDVAPLKRKNVKNNCWFITSNVDETKFDFGWHPDPTDPPYIYKWGCKFFPVELKSVIEYHTPNATQVKYMLTTAELAPDWNRIVEEQKIDRDKWDLSWQPSPLDPPYIYIWGNKYIDGRLLSTLEYHTPGATEKKYMPELLSVLPEWERWTEHTPVDKSKFDFSWRPDPREPDYIYVWGNKYEPAEIKPTLEYKVPGATEIKYMTNDVPLSPEWERWKILHKVDMSSFDFSWRPDPLEPPFIYIFGNDQYAGNIMPTLEYHVPGATERKYINDVVVKLAAQPERFEHLEDATGINYAWVPDPTSPPYIYVWGNQWNKAEDKASIIYRVEGATEHKYMEERATKAPTMINWSIPDYIDIDSFDFSWEPNPHDPPYIYEFGTQWQKTGGPSYSVPGATEIKYIDVQRAKAKPRLTDPSWQFTYKVDESSFDYSWHPDNTEQPYIYLFGCDRYPVESMPVVKYEVPGATEIKYIQDTKVKLASDPSRFVIPENIDTAEFDFSWVPDPNDPPYIYQFGTQWQKTGGPRYVVSGATEIKYVEGSKARTKPDTSKWIIEEGIVIESFDYSWHPDDTEEPYIYVFGNQYYSAEKMPTIRYEVKGATQVKYIDNIKAELGPNYKNWSIPKNIDKTSFDFSWVPDPNDPPYIYEFATNWNDRGGPRYVVSGATDFKYITDIKAKTLPDKKNWNSILPIVEESFDFSWVPHPESPPYIYVFGNQWNSSEKESTIEYRVPGATDKKYINHIIATVAQNKNAFVEVLPVSEFDFSWRPDPYDPPLTYVFGNKYYPAEKMPTVEYRVEGATEKKYINDLNHTCKLRPKPERFDHHEECELSDYSWVPDPDAPPYIYAWGNQWNKPEDKISVSYTVEGATEYKYMEERAKRKPSLVNWEIPDDIDQSSFDFSWEPNPHEDPYIYQFGTQWQKTDGPRYVVEDAKDIKYIDDIKSKRLQTLTNWYIPTNVNVKDFDFSWHPDSNSPPYIYQFGTVLDREDGPRYITPGNAGEIVYLERVYRDEKEEILVSKYYIDTTLEDLISKHPDEVFWATRKNINYEKFDFEWRPDIIDTAWEKFIHVFGSPDSELTQTYFVNAKSYLAGEKQFKFVEEASLSDEYLSSLFVQPDMFFVDKGNEESKIRFERLKSTFGDKIQKTRFLNTWVDTITRCANRSSTELCWILNSELDYTNFDFNYYPNPWQMKMVHVFGTQWSHWGTTFMINRDTFAEDTKYIKIVEHLSNLNFVKNRKARATNNLYNILLIDHDNKEFDQVKSLLEFKAQGKNVKVFKFNNSYLDTFKSIFKDLTGRKEEAVWICSSICDYKDFNFSYICDPFAKENLHVFPSDKQKFGDTFLVDINKTKEIIQDLELLQQYEKVNYNQHQKTRRLDPPIYTHNDDTHIDIIKQDYDFPYAVFQTQDFDVRDEEPISLWRQEDRNILVTATGGSRIIVPKEVKRYVQKELYDYPYIKTQSKLIDSKPLDIVFLSNGEKFADDNYEHLLRVTHGLKNRIVRVDGVNGRVQAYHAASEASHTPWSFNIFAKLYVSKRFDWGWQPDRLQEPKHYIFHAKNPVNDLEYGHQAIIAYNKKIVLKNEGKGLDFTLDDLHETVPVLSGVANFNTDPFSTWRTAFREVIKLNYDTTDIGKQRLETWLNVAKGNYADWCKKGASDAIKYCQEVNDDLDKLKLSYEWSSLSEIFKRYNPD